VTHLEEKRNARRWGEGDSSEGKPEILKNLGINCRIKKFVKKENGT